MWRAVSRATAPARQAPREARDPARLPEGPGKPDPQCGALFKNKEGASCGLGAELVLLLPLLGVAGSAGRGATTRWTL